MIFVFLLFLGSSLAVAPNPCNGNACDSNTTCSVGQCCSGKCILQSNIPYVAGGATCDLCHFCQAPFECINGLCLVNSIDCPCSPNSDFTIECTPNDGGFPLCTNNACASLSFTGDSCSSSTECYPTPGVTCSTTTNKCEGSGAEGAACTVDTDCGLNLFCKNESCSAKYILASGASCIFSQECIGPLFLGGAWCTKGKCVPASSVSNGGACEFDFQCQSGAACVAAVCTSTNGQSRTYLTDCGAESGMFRLYKWRTLMSIVNPIGLKCLRFDSL